MTTTDICWRTWGHSRGCPHETHDRLFVWGRCRDGDRWFWVVADLQQPHRHGWATTEPAATELARTTVTELAAGAAIPLAIRRHAHATTTLKTITLSKRDAHRLLKHASITSTPRNNTVAPHTQHPPRQR